MTTQTQDEKDGKAIRRAIVDLIEAVQVAEEHGLHVTLYEFTRTITPVYLQAAIRREL